MAIIDRRPRPLFCQVDREVRVFDFEDSYAITFPVMPDLAEKVRRKADEKIKEDKKTGEKHTGVWVRDVVKNEIFRVTEKQLIWNKNVGSFFVKRGDLQ